MIAAIVPAAGQSSRMGRPKLTLPLSGGEMVIARVVSALKAGGADPVLVIGPPRAEPHTPILLDSATDAGALVLSLSAPTPEMRATVEAGLLLLENAVPHPSAVLICPGDSVGLTAELVSAVVVRLRSAPESIVIPRYQGHRGHPLGLPWEIALAIRALPPDLGINALRERFADRLTFLDVSEPGATVDLDTPEDYRNWAPAS